VPNPLKSEADAFRTLLYFVAVIVVIALVVLVVRALR
jgi:hypothetical protein